MQKMNKNINWDSHIFTTPSPYSVKKYGPRSKEW